MAYSSPPANATTFVGILEYFNSTSHNLFTPLIVVGVFFIIFIKLMFNSNEGSGRAFVTASFICMMISILLRVINLGSNILMVTFIIMTGLGAVWNHLENTRGVA